MNRVIEYLIKAKDVTQAAVNSAKTRIKSFGASVKAVMSSVGQHLKNAAVHFRDFAKGVGTNLMNIKAGFDMARGVVGKFVGFFQNAIGEAFKFEKAVANFKTLLGNVDAAREHLGQLRDFASKTPLTLDDLMGASKLLLSFGASVDSIMPSLKMLGDISMGDAQKFQGLALVFAQVKSAGKLMGQDLLQMINQGFNPLTEMAKQTGKSVSELKDLMSKGAISFEMVEASMKAATSAGGLFAGAMKESATTGEGLMSTLKDNWVDALRTFGEKLMDVSKNGIRYLIGWIQRLKSDGTIERWAERAKKAITAVIGVVKGLADAQTRKQTFGAIKDILIGGFEAAATAAGKILLKVAQAVGTIIADAISDVNPFSENSQWQKEARVAQEMGYKDIGKWDWSHEGKEGIEEVRKEVARRDYEDYKKRYGLKEGEGEGEQSRLQRGLATLEKIGRDAQKKIEDAAAAEAAASEGADNQGGQGGGKDPFASFGEEAKKQWQEELARMLEGVVTEQEKAAEDLSQEKTSQAFAMKVKMLGEYYDKLAKCESKAEVNELKKERAIQDKKIAFIRELEKEQAAAAKKADALAKKAADEQLRRDKKIAHAQLEEAKQTQDAAKTRMEAAQSAVARAWGWYKDKDSLREQITAERQDNDARKQYRKDYKSLTHGRWADELAEAKELQRRGRTDELQERMEKWRKGAFGLSVEEEATMRVALAEDEQKNAARSLLEISENTKSIQRIVDILNGDTEGA